VLEMLHKMGVEAKLEQGYIRFIIEKKNPQGRIDVSCQFEIKIIEKEDIFHVELQRIAGSSQLF